MMLNPETELKEYRPITPEYTPSDPKQNPKNPRCRKCKHYLSSHRKTGCIVEVGLYSHKECGCIWNDEEPKQ